jgi:hypothetical protein
LKVPTTVIRAKTTPYMRRGKPAHRSPLVNEDDYTIVSTFGAEYRGLVNYYLLAGDVYRLSRVRWVMETALLKTLACKHDSSVSKMAALYKAKIETPAGIRTCFEVRVERDGRKPLVARFSGQPLKKKRNAVLVDRKPVPGIIRRKELIDRLLAGRCEFCGHRGEVQVHHVRKLADLTRPGRPQPLWAETMAKRRRKPSYYAPNATTPSMDGTPPQQPRNSHWRARCLESGHDGFGRGCPEKDQQSGTSPDGLPH